jgi:3-hydroxyisobutyrate dehydrogenase
MTTVAVLGTGIMGAPMARTLAQSGHQVRAWNRTAAKAQALTDAGVVACATPREAVEGADIALTMLLDVDAVADTMTGDDGALSAAGDDLLWLQCSTVGIEGTERLSGIAADAGVTYLDCPVLGTRTPAEQGALVVLASGPQSARDTAQPVFDAIGSRTIWLGDVGAGSRLKLVVNSWVLAVTTSISEVFSLAQALDVDPELFFEAVDGGALDLPYARVKGKLITAGDFPADFELSGAAKDSGLIADAARDAGVHLSVAEAVRSAMEAARDAGHGEEDMAAVWYASRKG